MIFNLTPQKTILFLLYGQVNKLDQQTEIFRAVHNSKVPSIRTSLQFKPVSRT